MGGIVRRSWVLEREKKKLDSEVSNDNLDVLGPGVCLLLHRLQSLLHLLEQWPRLENDADGFPVLSLGQVQRSPSAPVHQPRVGSKVEQDADAVGKSPVGGNVQRSLSVAVEHVRLGFALEQEPQDLVRYTYMHRDIRVQHTVFDRNAVMGRCDDGPGVVD